ncbi:Protein strawberry notch 2 [Balamuthia mandrillaris]
MAAIAVDRQGRQRGKCNECECVLYCLPQEENSHRCEYCGHYPTAHALVASSATSPVAPVAGLEDQEPPQPSLSQLLGFNKKEKERSIEERRRLLKLPPTPTKQPQPSDSSPPAAAASTVHLPPASPNFGMDDEEDDELLVVVGEPTTLSSEDEKEPRETLAEEGAVELGLGSDEEIAEDQMDEEVFAESTEETTNETERNVPSLSWADEATPVAEAPEDISKPKEEETKDKDKVEEVAGDEEEADEELEVETELYASYKPQTPGEWQAVGEIAHPAFLMEATSLAAIIAPKCNYIPLLPDGCLERGKLSTVQLEAVCQAGSRHELMLEDGERAGYFIGDGTGVGKGREIAAIIVDNYLRGRRKAVWMSMSPTLLYAAKRDMEDIGAGFIPLHEVPSSYDELTFEEGVLFLTYSKLVSKSIGQQKTRYQQLIDWLRREPQSTSDDEGKDAAPSTPEFEGVIVLDEGHRAKNLVPESSGQSSKTGILVSRLQKDLSKARLVYSSATGATEARNMGYMARLGLWGPNTGFSDFKEFKKLLTEAGLGSMELVAMEMKRKGMYCSRHLSFKGVDFDILQYPLKEEEKVEYDEVARLWQELVPAYLQALEDSDLPLPEQRWRKALLWAAHQRFFILLALCYKVEHVVKMVEDYAESHAVVIGMFSTGEAQLEYDLAKRKLKAKQARTKKKKDKKAKSGKSFEGLCDMTNNISKFLEKWFLVENACGDDMPVWRDKRDELLRKTKQITLPCNPLDLLIHHLGGSDKVAEITGRRKAMVWNARLKRFVVSVRDPNVQNLSERDAFMDGEKMIAIISEAGSVGISLQADRGCLNQRRRLHIIVQLPWAADKAMQQLGRTHRSNQHSAPHYKLVVTELGGEWRLASAVAQRAASLGALTSADRRAAGAASSSLSKYLINTEYGNKALSELEEMCRQASIPDQPLANLRSLADQAESIRLFQKEQPLKKFLNRIMGLEVNCQNALFENFYRIYLELVQDAKKKGVYSESIMDVKATYESSPDVIDTASGPLTCYRLVTDRGLSWEDALHRYLHTQHKDNNSCIAECGFYKQNLSGDVVLALPTADGKKWDLFKPNIGRVPGKVDDDYLLSKYTFLPLNDPRKKRKQKKRADDDESDDVDDEDSQLLGGEVKGLWKQKYEESSGYGIGKRHFRRGLLTGSVLPFFRIIRSLCHLGLNRLDDDITARGGSSAYNNYRRRQQEQEVIIILGDDEEQQPVTEKRKHNEEQEEDEEDAEQEPTSNKRRKTNSSFRPASALAQLPPPPPPSLRNNRSQRANLKRLRLWRVVDATGEKKAEIGVGVEEAGYEGILSSIRWEVERRRSQLLSTPIDQQLQPHITESAALSFFSISRNDGEKKT